MTLYQHFLSEPVTTVAGFVLMLLIYVVACLLPVCGLIYGFYILLTLPMRRNERARLFLDLLELGLKDGRTPEAAVMEASASHDRSMGARFHLLAAHLRKGLRLSAALEKVPRLLPPQIRAMLKAGERIGDAAKVLPACRQLLRDGVSQVRGALNYLIILAFCVTPFTIFVPLVLSVKVIPKYKEVFQGMTGGAAMPAFSRFVFSESRTMIGCQVVILCLIWLAMIAYVGGPRLHAWLGRLLPGGVVDAALCRLPWRRKRLQRDFSAMLAVLLDAGVPEAEAVALAADSTGNTTIARRAAKTRALLNNGVKLTEAIRAMDDSGELHWRLTNATHGRGGFLRALSGWHDTLDAKAFQLEQAAAQITTTAFVLFNGLFVASIVIAVFLLLINLINQASLW
jgi:type II secretory pathway component PulF